ncbi:MAG: ribbon-helix-helix domain-containing protein [Aliihoeflea sp.]|uniref:ribbon-helix-helix domain-containing protein n=1 Tax=Aliihoeflea sp. TaxID=2608088 RepID=UPI0040332520
MSGIVKRSMSIRGHRTSISLEDAFFEELNRLAGEESMSLAALVAQVDATRDRRTNLSSALRLFVLDELKRRGIAGQ